MGMSHVFKSFLASTVLAGGLAIAAMPASAVPVTANGCPTTIGHPSAGGGGPGNATDCNLVITFSANGSIATAAGPQTTYDSIEDALIGVINNSGHTIFSFNLSGSGIAGFDGDGIDAYANGGPIAHNANDTTGYGGEFAWFTNIHTGATDSLTVNFIGGIATGHTSYFSLEEPASLSLKVTAAPEPMSVALLGSGLLGLGLIRRQRS